MIWRYHCSEPVQSGCALVITTLSDLAHHLQGCGFMPHPHFTVLFHHEASCRNFNGTSRVSLVGLSENHGISGNNWSKNSYFGQFSTPYIDYFEVADVWV
jgi:hypothetical protein